MSVPIDRSRVIPPTQPSEKIGHHCHHGVFGNEISYEVQIKFRNADDWIVWRSYKQEDYNRAVEDWKENKVFFRTRAEHRLVKKEINWQTVIPKMELPSTKARKNYKKKKNE